VILIKISLHVIKSPFIFGFFFISTIKRKKNNEGKKKEVISSKTLTLRRGKQKYGVK
jgi:hypothetical protein